MLYIILAQIPDSGAVDLGGVDIEEGNKDIIMPSQPQRTTPMSSVFINTRTTTTAEATQAPSDSPIAIPPAGLLSPYQPGRYQPLTSKEKTDNKLVNLYFLILALGVILAFVSVYFYRRKKKSKGQRALQGGQVALRRDLEAGGWRVRELGRWDGPGGVGGTSVREEGLNERGEAPPPYTRTVQGSLDAHTRAEGSPSQGASEGYVLPRLPQRALTLRGIVATHGEEQGRLPTYEDVASIRPQVGDMRREIVTRTMEVVETHPPTETGLQAGPPSQDRNTVST